MQAAIDALAKDPRPSAKLVKAIQGTKESFLRYRVGDHRILYEVFDQERTLLILGVVHRTDLEDWLRRQR
jgi:mRNA-degrading endonuclease RelE of RelBE toxin-antitoxin system